jgi:hypothetical protein
MSICSFALKALVLLVAAAAVLACAEAVSATTYEVGDGKPYTSIGAVPWESIAAGDTVLIYYRATPYREKWAISAQGTSGSPIVIRGVPSGGNLPVIDGQNATTRLALSYWNDERCVVKVGGGSVPPDQPGKYITFENLHIKSALSGYTYTCDEGTTKTYTSPASPIYICFGENITVRNCIFSNSSNGFFVASSDSIVSQNITIEGCYIYDNGNSGSIYEHNSYNAAKGITYQYNHYGPLRAGCSGNNLKDRSSNMVVRYNWIEDGNRQLDLVDGGDSSIIRSDPLYLKSWVYGNILKEGMSGNRQIVHYGGDSGTVGNYRNGTMYFYNNTVVSTRTDRNTLFRLSCSPGSADTRNNIIYGTLAGNLFEINSDDSTGTANLRNDWLKTGWVAGGGTVNDLGGIVTGSSPGFVNEGTGDYHLAVSSTCINAGTTLHSDCASYPVSQQYVKHQGHETRPVSGALDIGAFEYNSGIADLVITTTSLPGGTAGTAYSQTLAATGGQTPYTWSMNGGSLPAGLSLSAGGVISGTPTTANTYNFTVRVTDSQGTPDTDDQALSVVIGGGGTGATYQFTAADTESNTTSTTFQTKATLAFTPSAAEFKGSSESYSPSVQLVVDGTAEALTIAEANDATDYQPFQAVKFRNLTAAAHTITIQYKSENTAATAYIRKARIVAIRKASIDFRQTASDSTVALTTTMANRATLTFTPASVADYLILYFAEVSANTAYSTSLEARIPGGASWDNAIAESKDDTDYFPWLSILCYNCPASSQSFYIAAAKETGSTATHNIRRARIVAIRLDGRFADCVNSSSDTEATTTSTSFVEKYTKSWTWGAAGNWLLINSARIAGTNAGYSTEARSQMNDSTTCAQQLREPNDTTDYMQFVTVDVRSLSGTKRFDVDYRSENAAATAKIRTVRFCGLSLDD